MTPIPVVSGKARVACQYVGLTLNCCGRGPIFFSRFWLKNSGTRISHAEARRRGGGERSLNQIDKKVGTPRRRCPKHQAQRAVSGIQRRLRRERRTATVRHPYHFLEIVCIEVIVSLQLEFAAPKKGGMAVPAVWRLVYFLAPCPLEPRSPPTHTGETRCVPLLKSKSKLQFRRKGFVLKC